MKIRDLYKILNELYPISDQEVWDNSGILCDKWIDKIVNNPIISLDVNNDIINKAIENNSNLIISHHPIYIGNLHDNKNKKYIKSLLKVINKNKITVISLHTNFDKNEDGMNKILAEKLKLINIKKIGEYGFVGIGNNKTNIKNICENYISNKKISLNNKRIYVCGGAGSSEIEELLTTNIDIFITGEIKWHLYNIANDLDKTLIDIGHSSEYIFVEAVESILNKYNISSIKSTKTLLNYN